MRGHFAQVRVWPGQGWRQGARAPAEPIWVRVEPLPDGTFEYAFSNRPADTSCVRAVRPWKSRGPVEPGYQPMKDEWGGAHIEGRSWRGFHHHAARVLLAYGFLLLERHRATMTRTRRVKKGAPNRC